MSISTQVRRRRRRHRTWETEYLQLVFDVTKEIPDLGEYFKSDWRIEGQIVVAPIVILHLSREVEREEENNV